MTNDGLSSHGRVVARSARGHTLPGALGELAGVIRDLLRIPGERRAARPRPPETGIVIDVGGGHSPHPRADLLIDKYVADDFERGDVLAVSKAVVVGDGHALPLADHSADYVIAAHVLEHATDPVQFAAELARVAPAGFVQTPSRLAEAMFGWAFHPWLIDREGDTLVFQPKPRVPALGASAHDVYDASALFRLAFFCRRAEFHHTRHWRAEIPVRVTAQSSAEATASFDLPATLESLGNMVTPPLTPVLRAALRCPACRGSLVDAPGELRCTTCETSYPVVREVPVLLTEAARRTPTESRPAPRLPS